MSGTDRQRFCGACQKDVIDLSQMTEPEARGLIEESRGKKLCVQLRHNGRGGILFKAEGGAVALGLTLLFTGCHSSEATSAGPDAPVRAPVEPPALGMARSDAAMPAVPPPHSATSVDSSDAGMYLPPETTPSTRGEVTPFPVNPHGTVNAPMLDASVGVKGCLCDPGDSLCSCL